MSDHLVWAELDMVIVRETDRAVGFGDEEDADELVWLPKSQLGRMTYADGGDSREVQIGERVTHVEIPEWLAHRHDLEVAE